MSVKRTIVLNEGQIRRIFEATSLELLRQIAAFDEKPENVGYHGGNLGSSESFAQNMNLDRDTGHFGTGTYFVGDEAKLNSLGYKERPKHKVDFSPYKLVKIKSFELGLEFHNALRDINNKYFSQFVYDGHSDEVGLKKACKVVAVMLFKDINDFSDLKIKTELVYDKVINLYKEYVGEYQYLLKYGKSDRRSISTELISSFGYDGVDCRSCKDMDNTMFGSVIYNLNK